MKTAILAIFVALAMSNFVNCSRPLRKAEIDPAFSEQIAEFERVTGTKVNVTISFGPIEPKWDAQCYRDKALQPNLPQHVITVNHNTWQYYGHYGREQLMFHELGHCVLGRPHNNDLTSQGEPHSIMYWQTFGDSSYYELNRQRYLNELLNGDD